MHSCILVCVIFRLALRKPTDSATVNGCRQTIAVGDAVRRPYACHQVAEHSSSPAWDASWARLPLSIVMYTRHVVTGGNSPSPFMPQRSSPTKQPSVVAVDGASAFAAGASVELLCSVYSAQQRRRLRRKESVGRTASGGARWTWRPGAAHRVQLV